tara:strand:+ start:70 stop:246 length:177 start_codon:yes stop_codon:yes gene_type:complete
MNDIVINLSGGIRSVTKVAENVYTVIDNTGNVFTLTEAQVRALPAQPVITEGKQLICG